MLTPQEISGKELVKAVFGGYDMAVVDDFLDTVTEDYTALYKENAALKAKIKSLVEKLEEYRSTEDAMRMALLTAQKTGNDMLKSAQEKSEEMLKSATEESISKYNELAAALEVEEKRLAVAKQATRAFVNENRALLAKIDTFLQAVPTLEKKPEPQPAPEQAKEAEIMDTVHNIDTAVTKIAEEEIPAAPPVVKSVTTKIPVQKVPSQPAAQPDYSALDAFNTAAKPEPVNDVPVTNTADFTQSPKFDFENLRFGTNFGFDD